MYSLDQPFHRIQDILAVRFWSTSTRAVEMVHEQLVAVLYMHGETIEHVDRSTASCPEVAQ